MAELIIARPLVNSNTDIKVVQYSNASDLPVRCTKNTIAVISSIPVANVLLTSESLPESKATGDVIILHRPGDFLDLSSRTVEWKVKVTVVRQFDGEKWNNLNAFVFNGEEWLPISHTKMYIYNRGETNDYLVDSWANNNDRNGKVTWNEDHLKLSFSSTEARYASTYTTNKIDITAYSKFVVVINNTSGASGETGRTAAGLVTTPYTGVGASAGYNSMAAGINVATKGITEETTYEVDISALEGEYHIQVLIGIFNASYYEIYME